MSQMDTNDTTSVANTLKLRNTETSALKRMPVADTSSSASAAARKTIKLKPLTPQTTGISQDNDPSSMAVASPLINKVGIAAPPQAAGEVSPPQFMSTATAPVAKIPVRDKGTPGAAPMGGSVPASSPAPTATTSIPRLNLTPKAVSPVSSAAQTISLTPSAAQGKTTENKESSTVSTASGSIPKYAKTASGAIPKFTATASGSVPKYVATSTSALPRASAPPPAQSGVAPKYVSTATSPIPSAAPGAGAQKGAPLKDAIDQAKLQSGMQGAKPAIKLRPSANPDGPAAGAGAGPSAPTIKLAPKMESGVTPLPPAGGSAPAPRSSDTMTAKISRKGVNSVSPSAPTVSAAAQTLQMQPSSPVQKAPQTPAPEVSNSAPTVQLEAGVVDESQKTAAPPVAPVPPAPPETAADPGVTTKIPRKLGLKKAESAAPAAATTVQASPAAPTVQASPAAPTVQATPAQDPAAAKKTAPTLREQEVIAKVNLQVTDQEGAQALELGTVENKVAEEPVKKKKKSTGGEPNMFFAVCVIVAFVVTLFTVYTLVAHYLNTWEGKKLPVVGFEQLDEHLKKK